MQTHKLPAFQEAYYSVGHVACLWEMSEWWVREQVRNGKFRDEESAPGEDESVLQIGGEIRIAASALNRFRHRHIKVMAQPVTARTRGELLRKIRKDGPESLPCRDVVQFK